MQAARDLFVAPDEGGIALRGDVGLHQASMYQ